MKTQNKILKTNWTSFQKRKLPPIKIGGFATDDLMLMLKRKKVDGISST